MLWLFQVNREGTQPYIHMYPVSPKLSSHPGKVASFETSSTGSLGGIET